MPLGMEVGLGPGETLVLDADRASFWSTHVCKFARGISPKVVDGY